MTRSEHLTVDKQYIVHNVSKLNVSHDIYIFTYYVKVELLYNIVLDFNTVLLMLQNIMYCILSIMPFVRYDSVYETDDEDQSGPYHDGKCHHSEEY